ncbi:MAG TPA: hypothetical protein VFY80_10285, partial [Burkholderiales bacterium]|nr:hypothetical protein [Burkholderiales bacterium]
DLSLRREDERRHSKALPTVDWRREHLHSTALPPTECKPNIVIPAYAGIQSQFGVLAFPE